MKVWVTKYALTTGVVVTTGEVCSTRTDGSMLSVKWPGSLGNRLTLFGLGVDWHKTEESAKARVLAMIEAKRKSIQRSLAKLDELAFDVETGKMKMTTFE